MDLLIVRLRVLPQPADRMLTQKLVLFSPSNVHDTAKFGNHIFLPPSDEIDFRIAAVSTPAAPFSRCPPGKLYYAR